ncbi:MAG: class I SAM-dependent RNA methyltransferase [Nitrospirae bacterium]|nr:class I SAM-dependent RNA methyltransferase [Nitrospirota bacterium]
MQLKADCPVYGGYVIVRDEGVVFVKGAIPEEVVEVSVIEKKKDYSIAVVLDVIEPSPFRVRPPCLHFGLCGGCQFQFISYEKQVSMKQEIMLDCLRRIGGIETELRAPLIGNDFNYRLRAQFKVSKEGQIGFYKEASRDVVPIDNCLLMDDRINEALGNLKKCNLSGIKEIHITCGDKLIALIKGMGFNEALSEEFIGVGFSGIAFDDYKWRGAGYTSFDLRGLTYSVSPWTFLQSNWALNTQAVELIVNEIEPITGQTIIDLYSGAGNLSLPLARDSHEVVAIEENPYAIKDGKRNLEINNIQNFRFLKSDWTTIEKGKAVDIVILDPPRIGLTDKVIKMLREISPQRIVYVSCNPATLARDLKRLNGKYRLDSIRLMDFFPHTYHIESLTFLSLANEHRVSGQADI